MPLTFCRRLEDNPAFVNCSGENGRVRYGRISSVGYGYCDEMAVGPTYASRTRGWRDRPKELKAFAKVELAAHETRAVELTLGMPALAYFDDARAGWVAHAGEFEVLVGRSARNIHDHASFVLTAEWVQVRELQQAQAGELVEARDDAMAAGSHQNVAPLFSLAFSSAMTETLS